MMESYNDTFEGFELPCDLNPDGSLKTLEQAVPADIPGKKEAGAKLSGKPRQDRKSRETASISDGEYSRLVGRSLYFHESFYERIRLCAFVKKMSIAKYIMSCIETQVAKDVRTVSGKTLEDILNQ